ncbi:MAG: molybdopterin converting factor subunit 1 [Sedimenticola sp.]|jgi:molybdopterin synthase sulfur carrier subunit|nr:MAG: molybdopterin converting factor subunit 1 [Sedimenticola sp.]
MIKVLYFARLREQLDTESEQLELAAGSTLSSLLAQLTARGGVWQDTFGNDQLVMMAVNQEMAEPDTIVNDGDEIAFFPPVTGG